MWKTLKSKGAEKIDVKITGYISVMMFVLALGVLIYLIGLSAGAAGELESWVAFAGCCIMVFCGWAILLSQWGQKQTGRRLKINKLAIWLNGGLIGVLAVIYVWGILLSVW